MPNRAFIEVHDLHKSYLDGEGNKLRILRGVELKVSEGETVAITGSSGAGKSTFLHMLGALDSPDSGQLHVAGMDLSNLSGDPSARFRNETIGFVFQFHHLLTDFNALENVMMPMWIRAGRTRSFRAEGMQLLEEVGIAHRADHKPGQLSGGEQQRLAIARALANRPKLLLADEPTGNLDQATGDRVSELILRLNREHSLTMVMVTHNLHLAARMDHQFDLEQGHLSPAPRAGGNG